MVDLGGNRGWLNAGPAASIGRIDRQIGHRLQITEAGRSWDQQNDHYQRYRRNGYPIALSPDGPPKGNGPSIHQLGGAIDTNEGQRIVGVLNEHGWRHTVYRNGVLVEPWHFEYFAHLDNHRFDPAPAGQEEDDMFNNDDRAKLENLYAAVFTGGPSMDDGGRSIAFSLFNLTLFADRIDRAVGRIETSVSPILRNVDGKDTLISLRQEVADAKTGVLTLLGRPAGVAEVEEEALAAALAPLLRDFSDDEVERFATAAADEQDRRARERLS